MSYGVMSVNNKRGAVTIAASDLSLAAVATSGSYTDLSNTPAAYVLPAATTSALGGVKIGTGLSVDGTGLLTATAYSLPAATTSTLGGVIVSTGLSIDGAGHLSANVTSVAGKTGAVTLTVSDVSRSIVTETTNYTATTSDYTILVDATAGAVTITLPAASGLTGQVINIKKIDSSSNAVTISRAGTDTIDGGTTLSIATQYQAYTVQTNGSAWWVI